MSLEEILKVLQIWIEDESIDDSFTTFINYAILEAEDLVDWPSLYGEKTITVGSDGVFTIPPDARKITSVESSTQTSGRPDYLFLPRDVQPSNETGGIVAYTLNPYEPVQSDTASRSCTIVQDSTTVALAAGEASSTWVGSRLQVGNSRDLFEILSVDEGADTMVISAPVQSNSGIYTCIVQPLGMDRYILKDKNETAWSGDIVVKYQKKHPELVANSHRLLIGCPQTVALLALQNSLITDKYAVDAQRLDNALLFAKNREIGNNTFQNTTQLRADRLFSVRSNKGTWRRDGQV